MNCPRLFNLFEIAVMDIGSRTTIHAKKEGLQKIYEQAQKELGFEQVAYEKDKEITELQDKLHRRNLLCNARAKEIKASMNVIKILGEGLNAIRDAFYNTKQNPQVFIGNVETILNTIKNKF